ncbi:hypothetical protein BC936DRAFT_139851 [Jimgerdemannia flammicorona]|uniref:Uncharacterized protein n=1 Tax=Jimgerdemannia flammicorona TaxID=994334 RepID=A0A433DHD5_9FUNG|nr:hypothetical protein BC936DRAFT_139851 [Jimgerdemannia flammicorona]
MRRRRANRDNITNFSEYLCKGTRPDRYMAKLWEESSNVVRSAKRDVSPSSVHIHRPTFIGPTFNGSSLAIKTISGEAFSGKLSEKITPPKGNLEGQGEIQLVDEDGDDNPFLARSVVCSKSHNFCYFYYNTLLIVVFLIICIQEKEPEDSNASELELELEPEPEPEPEENINKKSDERQEFTTLDHVLFSKHYRLMTQGKKWKLASGRYVEDVIYELGERCKYHHLVHSFILDIEEKFTRSAFTEEELEEISSANLRDLPDLKPELLSFISTFAKISTREIREELNRPHDNLGKDYDPSIHFAYDYGQLIEKNPNPLTMNWPESWYRSNVWRAVDNAFGDIPFVFVVGGEVAGIATTERKNRYRMLSNEVPMKRKMIGKKGDGFVRSVGTQVLEWAASEAGPRWEGQSGTKLKVAGFSPPRQLKDIFITLARKVDFDEDKIRQLDVPGFVHAGAMVMKVNIDCPKGYVMRYVRDIPCEVCADVNEFPRTLDALVMILYAKVGSRLAVMLRTMNIINSRRAS